MELRKRQRSGPEPPRAVGDMGDMGDDVMPSLGQAGQSVMRRASVLLRPLLLFQLLPC